MLVADPEIYPGGLGELLAAFRSNTSLVRQTSSLLPGSAAPHRAPLTAKVYGRAAGWTLSHEIAGARSEAALQWGASLLSQRRFWAQAPKYGKPLVTKVKMPLKSTCCLFTRVNIDNVIGAPGLYPWIP